MSEVPLYVPFDPKYPQEGLDDGKSRNTGERRRGGESTSAEFSNRTLHA